MPYQQFEEILSRRGEKIAAFLTLENATGLILGALPTYLISTALPLVPRIALIAIAAGLGVAATLDIGGMPLYARLIWRGRGALRLRLARRMVTPADLVGAGAVHHHRPLVIGGPIRLRPARPQRWGRSAAPTDATTPPAQQKAETHADLSPQ